MAFNPTEYFQLSDWMNERLPENAPQEAVIRSILSRVYYSALINTSIVTNTSTLNNHVNAIRALKGRRLHLGNKLADLKALREKADYEVDAEVTMDDVSKALRDAKQILGYLNTPPDANYPEYLVIPEHSQDGDDASD